MGTPTPTATPHAPGPPSAGPPDWWEVLGELDRRRARALTALDPERIVDYAWPDSAAWSADAALVANLQGRGLRPRGLSSRVLAVERAEAQGGRARVQIVDQRAAYTLVDARGAVVETVPAARLTRWSVTLAEDSTDSLGWRVVDVTAVDGRPAGEGDP